MFTHLKLAQASFQVVNPLVVKARSLLILGPLWSKFVSSAFEQKKHTTQSLASLQSSHDHF